MKPWYQASCLLGYYLIYNIITQEFYMTLGIKTEIGGKIPINTLYAKLSSVSTRGHQSQLGHMTGRVDYIYPTQQVMFVMH